MGKGKEKKINPLLISNKLSLDTVELNNMVYENTAQPKIYDKFSRDDYPMSTNLSMTSTLFPFSFWFLS